MTTERLGQTIIAGPCAAESRDQVVDIARKMSERDVRIIRASWWKPRTRPGGFEGAGEAAASWAAEVTRMGITIGTEVLIPDHVRQVVNGVAANRGIPQNILLWLGSRNQNHFIQREIAREMQDVPPEVKLMIKNQPWGDERHWLGIVDHITNAGVSSDRIMLCHRGFDPYGRENSRGLRNLPDWEMAMRVKEKTGLPMLVDPSHIGGSVQNVFRVTQEAIRFPFDGFIVEVHPDPTAAMTDAKQQLGTEQFDQMLKIIRG